MNSSRPILINMSKSNSKKLVIVESPTKAKTIRKFLGKDYIVESCMGHIRDLPQSAKDIPEKYKKEAWSKLGVNVEDNFDPIYCIPKNKTKVVKDLKAALAEADELILATDEDREGESISWHLVEALKPKVPLKRMVFHEITKEAIQEAINNFRDIDENLVRAQEARRILDRLVGYTLSPLLWKKVTYGLSAGRVQSVAVRLISEREHERLRFKKTEYWSLVSENNKAGTKFEARAHSIEGKRLASGKDFGAETGKLLEAKTKDHLHLTEKLAKSWQEKLKNEKWVVKEVEEKPVSRKPAPPFITSTLQQEANRKLGMSSRETMQVAQKLYEQGIITYMRTDSTNLSKQAIDGARGAIQRLFGKDYLPKEPRIYSGKKVKGAQEAHEAIRPAGSQMTLPDESGLSGDQYRLYELIWKRTIASQMVNAEQKQVSVKFDVGPAVFSASGMTIVFPGFLKVYVEGFDDEALAEEKEVHLPQLKVGESVAVDKIKPLQHETKPPARFTEASLVQTMEKEGIGRPSTYASIIGTIIDRGYVKKSGNALAPTFTALVVSKLLMKYLPDYVDLGFTSSMEKQLDDIADGDLDSIKYLSQLYFGDRGLKNQVDTQETKIDAEESRAIALEGLEGLSFRIGRYGAYVCRTENGEDICASVPETHLPGDLTAEIANKLIDQKINGADALGKDPETGLPVYVLTGRYGPYVQLGEHEEEKPKRMAIPLGVEPENVSLKLALDLLSLPKTLGVHPGTQKEVKKGLGRFGPYVVHDGDFRSIPKTDDIFSVELERALELLSQPKKGRGRAAPLKELGNHPETGDPIQVLTGKYGPYIKCGKTNVSVPEGQKPEDVTAEMAIELLKDRLKVSGKKKSKSVSPKNAPVAKKVSKKRSSSSKPKAKASVPVSNETKKKVIRRSALTDS